MRQVLSGQRVLYPVPRIFKGAIAWDGSLALPHCVHGSRTSSTALAMRLGAFWLLAQYSFLLEYCTVFIFGSIKETS
jgi:hypothetical protein